MKYTITINIERPRDQVVALFDNPDNLKHWQDGLISYEQLSSTPHQPGAKMKLIYKMGKREIEMVETLVKYNLPEELVGTYEADSVHNYLRNTFEVAPNGTTNYTCYTEFKMKALMMRLMAFLMPGAFKKQTLKFMMQFKGFVERQPEPEKV